MSRLMKIEKEQPELFALYYKIHSLEETATKYEEMIAVVAGVRETILKTTPDYDDFLGEMVACPQACIERIQQWVNEKALK